MLDADDRPVLVDGAFTSVAKKRAAIEVLVLDAIFRAPQRLHANRAPGNGFQDHLLIFGNIERSGTQQLLPIALHRHGFFAGALVEFQRVSA